MDGMVLLQDIGALVPHLIVLVTGLAILTLDLFLPPQNRYVHEVCGVVGLLLGGAVPAYGGPLSALLRALQRAPQRALTTSCVVAYHTHLKASHQGTCSCTPWWVQSQRRCNSIGCLNDSSGDVDAR